MRKWSFPEKVAVLKVTFARKNDYSSLLMTWRIAIAAVKLLMSDWNCPYKSDTFAMKQWIDATDAVK